jgi:hypothetical protein
MFKIFFCIPINELGKHITQVEYRTILIYHMIPLFLIDEVCHVCRKTCLDTFAEHTYHCLELRDFKIQARDVLFDIVRRTIVFVMKKTFVNFLTDPQEGRSTLKPTCVLVHGWVRWKQACMNFIVVFSLMRLGNGGFTLGQTTLKHASRKLVKHDKTCSSN